ncbi:MAG: gliding motility-associated C-terminal domain-containing protein [Bacteroides sp.]|nr:gliding motility-associated C-terminal domain-containing protein [Ruminococcus flavefaciens]MCM1554909.1 gliding motility-associated C-terminal domain-containing protein [Bacteroides sp.]
MFSLLSAQTESVYRAWGKSIGKAQTDRDFLIYDATCFDNKLFIVGKAGTGTGFELKRGENSYFYEKDGYTDAFLACYSLEGELQWSTYLPALEEGYYNAFATTVKCTERHTLMVIGNAYQIWKNVEETKTLIPRRNGKTFFFEFDLQGLPLHQGMLSYEGYPQNPIAYYPPKIDLLLEFIRLNPDLPQTTEENPENVSFAAYGTVLGYYTHEEYEDTVRHYIYSYPFQGIFLHYASDAAITPSYWNILSNKPYQSSPRLLSFTEWLLLTKDPADNYLPLEPSIFNSSLVNKNTEKASTSIILPAQGVDKVSLSQIIEEWMLVVTSSADQAEGYEWYAVPQITKNDISGITIFPGTVQKVHAFNGKYLIQGVHCRNYSNGVFKNAGEDYAYSHDDTHPIPTPAGGLYQARNNAYTAVPYLLLYDSATFFADIPLPEIPDNEDLPTHGPGDFSAPLWGSYLNADWLYEDVFHISDSTYLKDLYQPYEPILCSYGDRFFLIGNARTIGLDLIDNAAMTEAVNHHQGVILAFSMGCPAEKTTFRDVRFLCPGDSVELKVSPEYVGFKFRFKEEWLKNNSIVLNADNSRAWAKKEGLYHAVLDGSALGCPDARTDTIQIKDSPYPEPQTGLTLDTIASCAAAEALLSAVSAPDTTFSYLWSDGDTSSLRTIRFSGDSIPSFSVEVNGYCTSFRDSTFVRFLPPYVNLGRDSVFCISNASLPADTSVLLHLNARQGYFPDADWLFRWKINGKDAGTADSLSLKFSDLESTGGNRMQAAVSVFVSLSDTNTEGCTAGDTLLVTLYALPDFAPNRFLPQDSVLCAHLDLDLQLPEEASGFYRCFWLDQDSVELPYGHDTNRFTIQGMRGTDGFGAGTDTREPRFFQLKLEHKACGLDFFDTLRVYDQVKPTLELPFHDTIICLNESVVLDSLSPLVYRPFYGFEWNTGEKTSAYSFTDSSTYELTFSVLKDFAFCGYEPATDTVHTLWSDPTLTLISIPEDTAFCEKLSVTLDASVPFPSTRYSWQEGNLEDLFSPLDDSTLFTDPVIKVDREVTLALFVVDTMGCVNTLQVNVSEEDCTPQLSIPNVFTPNGDGINDVLKFKQVEKCFDVDILIVDRKGAHVLHEKVRDADDFSWNGCYKNGSKKLPDGAYFYMVSYKDAYGKKKVQSGSITILGTAE